MSFRRKQNDHHQVLLPVSKNVAANYVPMLDNMEMVQCDRCNLWFHFVCVNVGESISEKDFLKCAESTNDRHSKHNLVVR